MKHHEGFETKALPHLGAMLRAAAALVGPAEAEDAAQEALTRAWRAWPTLRDDASVRPWLLRITVNVCREWRRASSGRLQARTQPLPGEESSPFEWIPSEDDIGTSDHTGALDLRAALGALSEELRLIVVLRYYGGMDATEVGHVLDLPPATVRTRLYRALGVLRERLGSRGQNSRRNGSASDARGGMYA